MPEDILALLGTIPIFSDLSPADLETVASHARITTVPKNTVVITEGDESDALYVILSGKVKVYKSGEQGREIILNIQGPGDYFGELALMDAAPRSASVAALEPSRFSIVSKADFEECLSRNPAIGLRLMKAMAQRIRDLSQLVSNLALNDVYGRIASFLRTKAADQDGQLRIEQPLTYQDIADRVGASQEMVGRVMRELLSGGYIEIENKIITLKKKLPDHW